MKSNIIRYLLGSLIVAVCGASATNTMAFKLWSLQDWNMSRSDIGSSFGKVCLQNQSFYQGYWTLIKQGYTFGSFPGSSTCIDYMMGANSKYQAIKTNPIWDASSYWFFYTSLVSFESDNSWWYNFKYYDINTNSLQTFNVPSIAWFTYTLQWWQTVFFDEVYFWHDSIIFMDSSNHYTLQLLGTTLLENLVLYIDPFSNWDNIYLIDFNYWKARSASLSWDYVASIMLNAVDIDNTLLFHTIPRSSSYTVSAWNTSVWPVTAWNLCSWDWCKQSNWGYSSNMWSYNVDLNYVAPDYEVNNNMAQISWSVSQSENLEQYNACIDEYTYVKDTSSFWFRCREDFQNWLLTDNEYYYIEDYLLSWDWIIFDWNYRTDNCARTARIAKEMLDLYPDNYLRDIRLAYNWSSSSNGIDLTYICWNRPSQSTSSDWVSWWQDILNWIGVWNSSEGSWNVFDLTVDSFKNLISNPFNTYIIEPIQSEYNSWYNLVTPVTCTTTNNTFEYWDYLLYFWVVIIVVVLYWFFF